MWQNTFVEPFNGHMRDEYLSDQLFYSLLEAQMRIGDRKIEYNINGPHSAQCQKTPAAFVESGTPMTNDNLHSG